MTYVLRFANDADGRDTVAQFTGSGKEWPPPETLALVSPRDMPGVHIVASVEETDDREEVEGSKTTYWTRHHFSALSEEDHPLGVPTIRGALYVPEGYVDE